MLGVFRKSKKAILVDDYGISWREAKLKRIGNVYYDSMTGKSYPLNGKPIMFNGEPVYILDAMKGVVLQPEIDDKVLKLRTSPEFLSTILEPEILQRSFKFKPTMKTVLAALIIGIGVGLFFGLMF